MARVYILKWCFFLSLKRQPRITRSPFCILIFFLPLSCAPCRFSMLKSPIRHLFVDLRGLRKTKNSQKFLFVFIQSFLWWHRTIETILPKGFFWDWNLKKEMLCCHRNDEISQSAIVYFANRSSLLFQYLITG